MSQGWDIWGGGRPRGGTPEEELPTMKDSQQVKDMTEELMNAPIDSKSLQK